MRIVLLVTCMLLILACHNGDRSASPGESPGVTSTLSTMMEHISEDLSSKGPSAWLNYFDSSAHFFMANNGSLVFPNFKSGKNFINDTLVKMVQSVNLTFSNVKIDSLSGTAASIGAKYHEETKDMSGNSHIYDGYFTGLAVRTDDGWKLRNLHWSE